MHRIVPLSQVRPAEMRAVLGHEREAWARLLGWDFSATSALIERSIAAQAFNGFALRDESRVLAYVYFLADAVRSLLGSVHALPEVEIDRAATRLIDRTLSHLIQEVGAARIETQLLFLGEDDPGEVFDAWGATRYPRQFLRGPIDLILERLGGGPTEGLRSFRPSDVKSGAALILRSFQGQPDAQMSACYSSLEGCENFIDGALARNGCGTFETRASFLATRGGRPAGLILVSRISPTVGHVVQISVDPDTQGSGLGKTLMRAACQALYRRGSSHLSLSVSTGNRRARDWYLALGFTPVRDFAAYVWEKKESETDRIRFALSTT